MSREIKFRAWDGKMMVQNVTPWAENTIIDVDEYSHRINVVETIMQCTGLKDKNGVEIYEGDIVKGQYRNYTVEHLGAAFRLKSTDGSTPDLLPVLENSERIEVIGNIYEDSNLLGTNGKEGDK